MKSSAHVLPFAFTRLHRASLYTTQKVPATKSRRGLHIRVAMHKSLPSLPGQSSPSSQSNIAVASTSKTRYEDPFRSKDEADADQWTSESSEDSSAARVQKRMVKRMHRVGNSSPSKKGSSSALQAGVSPRRRKESTLGQMQSPTRATTVDRQKKPKLSKSSSPSPWSEYIGARRVIEEPG